MSTGMQYQEIGTGSGTGAPLLQAEAKIGILGGSLLSGLLGYALLRVAPRDFPATPSR